MSDNQKQGDYFSIFIRDGKVSGEVTVNGVTKRLGGNFKKKCTNGAALFNGAVFDADENQKKR